MSLSKEAWLLSSVGTAAPDVITHSSFAGANADEVAAMGQLTSNLHKLLITFYKPSAQRYKIVFEDNAFPSDNVSWLYRQLRIAN